MTLTLLENIVGKRFFVNTTGFPLPKLLQGTHVLALKDGGRHDAGLRDEFELLLLRTERQGPPDLQTHRLAAAEKRRVSEHDASRQDDVIQQERGAGDVDAGNGSLDLVPDRHDLFCNDKMTVMIERARVGSRKEADRSSCQTFAWSHQAESNARQKESWRYGCVVLHNKRGPCSSVHFLAKFSQKRWRQSVFNKKVPDTQPLSIFRSAKFGSKSANAQVVPDNSPLESHAFERQTGSSTSRTLPTL